MCAAALLERVPFFQNELAFTNAAVQPKTGVFRLIADLDFGQNDEKAARWLRTQLAQGAHVEPPHLLPGANVVNFNLASGGAVFPRHRWTRAHLLPSAHFRHTYLLFDVPPPLFDRFLEDTRTFVPGPAASLCPALASRQAPLAFGEPLGYGGRDHSGAVLVCLAVPRRSDLAVRGDRGLLLFGSAGTERRLWDRIGGGQEAWYRLETGWHAFGADLYEFHGRWQPRAEGIRVAWREADIVAGQWLVVRKPPQAALASTAADTAERSAMTSATFP